MGEQPIQWSDDERQSIFTSRGICPPKSICWICRRGTRLCARLLTQIASALFVLTLVNPGGTESAQSRSELERQAQRKLRDPGRCAAKAAGGRDLAEGWAVNVRSTVKEGWLGELRMIQNIEEFGAKLQLDPLRDRRGFGQRDVEVGSCRTAQQIAGDAIGPVGGVVNGIKLREARIREPAVKIRIVFERHVGKTVGVKDEVAGNRGCSDLANRARRICAVGDLINRPLVSGIERSDRCDLGSTRYGRIARSRRAGVCRVGVIRQLRGNVERESGSIGEDGIKAPALGKPL